MKLVTVYRTFSAADAQLVRSLLDAAEIPAMVSDELAALSTEGYSMSTGGIRVQVAAEDVESARELIEAKPEQTD
jgi:hypothetical protein